MTNAIAVAGYIKESLSIPSYDSKKIQKLLYFANAWHLAWTGRELVDEPFEAWPEGPVVRRVFAENKYRHLPSGCTLPAEQQAIVDAVLEHYGAKHFAELVELTHADAPWCEAREGLEAMEASRREISRDTMLDFYVHQGIEGADVPARPVDTREVPTETAREVARRVAERWQSALAMLATK